MDLIGDDSYLDFPLVLLPTRAEWKAVVEKARREQQRRARERGRS